MDRRTLLVLFSTLAMLLIGAAPASASTVLSPSVTNSPPSNAAGARTQYAATFTTSATGGLSAAANSRINVTFPAFTTFGGYTFGTVALASAPNTSIGSCGGASGLTIQCSLSGTNTIDPNTQVRVVLNGITNTTTTGPNPLTLSTTSDTQTINASFNVAAANPITNVGADNTAPSTAAGGRTQYAATFTTSTTGGLSAAANSRINVTFPAFTTFGGYTFGTVALASAPNTSIGSCGGASGLTIQCSLSGGITIDPNTQVRVVLNGITNTTTTGPNPLTLSTTSDTQTINASFNVAAANPITNVGADNTAPSTAAGGRTQYAATFTTSTTGGLSAAANSRINVTFPAFTTFGGYTFGTVALASAPNTSIGSCGGASGLTIQCSLSGGITIDPNTQVRVVLNGITNTTTTGPNPLTLSTTSDTQTINASFNVAAANPITNVGADNTAPSTAAGGRTQYAATFTTSTTGGLSAAANSRINVTFPANTTFGGYTFGTVALASAPNTSIGSCGGASGLTIQCSLSGGITIDPNTQVRVVLNGITNTTTTGPNPLTLSTTSDTQTINASFNVAAANPITNLSVTPASPSQSAVTQYVVIFTTSATGGMSNAANSRINVTFGTGTTFGSYTFGTVALASAPNTSIGSCGGASGLTIQCSLSGTNTIAPNTQVRVVFNGITNPSTPNSYTASVSTTSDPTAVPDQYSIAVDTVPPETTLVSGPPDTTTDALPTFTFSSSEPGSSFECRIDAAPFAPCTSPYRPPAALAPGVHTFQVRARDAAANTDPTPVTRTFTVAAVSQATPTPTPVPAPTPAPTPVSGRSVVVAPVSGKVLVRRPGSNDFVELDGTQGIPLGSTLDTKKGVIELSSVPKPGAKPQTARVYDGVFKVTQTKTTTDLTLNEPLAPCGKGAKAAARKPKTRKLWGDGKGSFRTRGQYSAATVRGTKWLVQDSCAGTLTKVAKGVVSVRDNVKRKTSLVKAGKSYLARPRR